MDHDQRCDVSNIPGTDFKLENKKLKDEIESLKTQHRIEKLEIENQSLKWENQVMILQSTNKNLKEEVENLKVENTNTKVGNQISKQQQHQAVGYISMEERLIEGVSRFIEGIEPKTKIYDSYVQWYNDVLKRMDHNGILKIQKYLFVCRKQFQIHYFSNVSFYSYIIPGNVVNDNSFKIKALEEGWTHENTRLACILHPKNPHQLLELYKKDINKDEKGKVWNHSWERKGTETFFKIFREKDISKTGLLADKCDIILCCIKK